MNLVVAGILVVAGAMYALKHISAMYLFVLQSSCAVLSHADTVGEQEA